MGSYMGLSGDLYGTSSWLYLVGGIPTPVKNDAVCQLG